LFTFFAVFQETIIVFTNVFGLGRYQFWSVFVMEVMQTTDVLQILKTHNWQFVCKVVSLLVYKQVNTYRKNIFWTISILKLTYLYFIKGKVSFSLVSYITAKPVIPLCTDNIIIRCLKKCLSPSSLNFKSEVFSMLCKIFELIFNFVSTMATNMINNLVTSIEV